MLGLRRFELPNRDTLELTLPAGWVEHLEQPAGGGAPTIEIAVVEGGPRQVFVTPEWPDPLAKEIRELPSLRDAVRDMAERTQPQAVEAYLEVRQLDGANGTGFYFAATDRNPGPDEFRFMNQGALQVGELTLWFTILTNEGQDTVVGRSARDAAGRCSPPYGARSTMNMNRRQWMGLALGAGATLGLGSRFAFGAAKQPLISAADSFQRRADPGHRPRQFGHVSQRRGRRGRCRPRRSVQDARRGRRHPSSTRHRPMAPRRKSRAGSRRTVGLAGKLFWATKVNVAPRGGGPADPAAARAQIEESFRRAGTETIDLIQVHNLGDVPVQLGILKELKAAKRVRYIGVTSTSKEQYGELARVMRAEPLDFIGVDYAVDNRSVEETILPLAVERGIAVMVYVPFGRTRLFQRVGDRPLPGWAAEFDAASWAQFFIKFVLGHPAVTVVTPATSKAAQHGRQPRRRRGPDPGRRHAPPNGGVRGRPAGSLTRVSRRAIRRSPRSRRRCLDGSDCIPTAERAPRPPSPKATTIRSEKAVDDLRVVLEVLGRVDHAEDAHETLDPRQLADRRLDRREHAQPDLLGRLPALLHGQVAADLAARELLAALAVPGQEQQVPGTHRGHVGRDRLWRRRQRVAGGREPRFGGVGGIRHGRQG